MDWTELEEATNLSLPDRLSIRLEQLILDGSLAPGDRLPSEFQLAQRFGVSRVTVRQALHELEIRALIDRRPGRGTVVLSPSKGGGAVGNAIADVLAGGFRAEVQHILELRALVEPPITALCAARATPRDVGQLETLVAKMRDPHEAKNYAALDRSFHQGIAQYTHNPLLAMINEQIANVIAPIRSDVLETEARRASSTAAHSRIVDAIAACDPVEAETAARAHIADVRTAISDVQLASAADAPQRG